MFLTQIPGENKSFTRSGPRQPCTILMLLMIGLCCWWPSNLFAATPSLKIAVNPWTASALNAELARVLLQEQLGY